MRITICIILFCILSKALKGQSSTAIREQDSTYSIIEQLKEVVVSAEKRILPINSIPIALTVITGKNLPNENNLDLRNLSGIVPNFYIQEDGLKLSTPLIYTRNRYRFRYSSCRVIRGRSSQFS